MLKLKTNKLQSLLNKVMKAVSNNKLLPITSLIGIKTTKEGHLLLQSYDGNNYLQTLTTTDYFEDNYVAINANSFYGIVSRINQEFITLEFTQKYLLLKTSGSNYKFDIAYEEDKVVTFPTYKTTETTEVTVDLKDLELALDLNKAAAAQTSELVSITGAYFGDKIVTTNGYTACLTKRKLFSKPLLLSYNTINLISALNGEKIGVSIGNKITFTDTEGTTIIGEPMEQVNEYPLQKVLSFLETSMVGTFNLSKKDLLQSLDRLNVFVDVYDQNILHAEVTETEFTLKGSNSGAVETFKLTGTNAPAKFKIDYGYLRSQVSSLISEVVTIKYGNPSLIIIEEKDAHHIIALVSEA